ncbi:MAG: hypothetical protein KCHDKBKB_02829 [Elusimicrobia bacterium]|nr:hypothetical protein [Elusimicrobiota bacterium]
MDCFRGPRNRAALNRFGPSQILKVAGALCLFTFTSPLTYGESLAGRDYSRITGRDFPFTDTYGDFAGLTFNALTQTFYMTDNKKDKILEIRSDGTLVRTIDIGGLKKPGESEADAEGITWMYGTTYALVMEGGEEMAVFQITSATTALTRTQATIYNLSGDPKGVTYSASDDALYFISEQNPMRVVKGRINPITRNLDIVSNIDLSGLPATKLGDVAYFPRLSPYLLFLSHSSQKIMEVDISGPTPSLRSQFSLAGWPIPDANGLSFDATGKMYVVGKQVSGSPEDDFNVFEPSPPISNLGSFPIPGGNLTVLDTDGNGFETVSLDGSRSFDPDGAIIDFIWRVNGTAITQGYGPRVSTFTYSFPVGISSVVLSLRDDAQLTTQATVTVTVLAQSSNLPPVANAVVPSSIEAYFVNTASVSVNATSSSDPENNPITRYRWTEGTTTYYDGPLPLVTFSLPGLGLHTLRLTVYSIDNNSITQSGFRDFSVTVTPVTENLAGRSFTRIIGDDFSFSNTYGDFAGLTFNALTQTFYMTDNKLDKILEIQANGTLVRTIDIAGLKRAGEAETDAEGITWMYGTTYALVLEGGEEMAVVQITPTTTSIARAQARIFDLSGDPKGVTYKASEDAIYWVSEDNPMRVVKSRINEATGNLETITNIDVTGLPATQLADVAYFPRLSPHLLLISHSSRTIMEVDLQSGAPVLRSSFSLSGWPIPEAGAMAFGADGKMYVVGKHVGGVPEDDFNVFQGTGAFGNQLPVANAGNGTVTVYDIDGNGTEIVSINGSNSYDPDGAIISYEWRVNGTVIAQGYGPKVSTFTYTFGMGSSTVVLSVKDDVNATSQTTVTVTVNAKPPNNPPVANATVPGSVEADGTGVAFINVNASASSDSENDPINRYRWTEGTTTYYDGTSSISSFTVTGVGTHVIRLTVYSTDGFGITQTGTRDFTVNVLPFNPGRLAGRIFNRIIGQDFSFSNTYGDFAGLTFNALTQTFYMTDNKLDKILEIQANGTLVRTIDIAGLKRAGEAETDAEGITWMYGTTYALVLEGGEEMAVVQITPTTTSIARAQARIFDLSGDPKGVTYKASEDAIYWVSEDNPMRVVKSRINEATGNLETITNIDVTGLPATQLADVAYFPRLSPHLLLISHSSRTIMEVDLQSGAPVLRSSFSLSGWPIPEAGAMAFGADGKMYVVGKHVGGVPEDDFNVFQPTTLIPNLPPQAEIRSGQGARIIDSDRNGIETVSVDGFYSNDLDGAIISYEWWVNGTKILESNSPRVSTFTHTFAMGVSTITLIVKDDAGASSQANFELTVLPPSSNLPPLANAVLPANMMADINGSVQVTVDASLSRDPENDFIYRYVWREGSATLYDGAFATATLNINGVGQHALSLTVFSKEANGSSQSGTNGFFLPFFRLMPENWQAIGSLT